MLYDNFQMNRVFALSFLVSLIAFVAAIVFLLSTPSRAQGYDVRTSITVASEIRKSDKIVVRHKKPRRTIVMQARKVEPIVESTPPIEPRPLCKAAIWANVQRDTVTQITELLTKLDATRDQISKLGGSGQDKVRIYRAVSFDYGAPGHQVYNGDWNEVLDAVQDMLQKRLVSITCKLRGLGVAVDAPKAVAPPT